MSNLTQMDLQAVLCGQIRADHEHARSCASNPYQKASDHWTEFMATWQLFDAKTTRLYINEFGKKGLLKGIKTLIPRDIVKLLPRGLAGLNVRMSDGRNGKRELCVYYDRLYR